MILASAGWGVWWCALLLHKFAPVLAPAVGPTTVVACAFAAVGLFLAVFTVRARLIWVLLAGVPIVANASLLLAPLLLGDEIARAFAPALDEAAPD